MVLRLQELRCSRNIKQSELAREFCVSTQSIINWESGHITPSIGMIIKISDYFSVSTDYLLGIDNRKYIEVPNLNIVQIAHIQQLIDDLRADAE